MLNAIHASEDLAAARREVGEIVIKVSAQKLGKAAKLVDEAVERH